MTTFQRHRIQQLPTATACRVNSKLRLSRFQSSRIFAKLGLASSVHLVRNFFTPTSDFPNSDHRSQSNSIQQTILPELSVP